MSLFRKLLIVIIFIIMLYILFRLIQKRSDIIKTIDKENMQLIEGIGMSSLPTITTKTVQSIVDANNIPQLKDDLILKKYYKASDPLKNFHIKASFNSAYDGTVISTDMVLYVLSRGYRYLDFEVYYDKCSNPTDKNKCDQNTAVVSYTDTAKYPASTSKVVLADILNIILVNGFSNPSPNKADPLFIQIRPIYQVPATTDSSEIKLPKITNNNQLNNKIEQSLKMLDSVRYNGTVSDKTSIGSLLGKVIIVMDKTSNPSTNTKTDTLKNLINIDLNSDSITTNNFSDILSNKESDDPKSDKPGLYRQQPRNINTDCTGNTATKIKGLQQIIPYDSKTNKILTQNPQILTIISKTPCNIFPMMVWMSSYIYGYQNIGLSQLGDYETMFVNAGGSAFLNSSEVVQYGKTYDPSLITNKILI